MKSFTEWAEFARNCTTADQISEAIENTVFPYSEMKKQVQYICFENFKKL